MKLNALLAGAAIALATSFAAASANATVLYDNHGPGTHDVQAWTLGFGYEVSDSFNLAQASTLTGVEFDAWNFPGEVANSVDWAILDGSPEFGGSTLFSGAGALSAANLGTNGAGYDITTYGFDLPSLSLAAGTYWLKLSNAQGAEITYWDESDGASQAFHNTVGHIPSETFVIQGSAGAGVPEPASWALMLTGFLGAGTVLRANRRRTTVAATA